MMACGAPLLIEEAGGGAVGKLIIEEDGKMSIAAVTLTGYVALEPRLWFTKQAHTPVVNLRVGMTPRRMDASTGEWKDGPSSFFTVNCWRKLALNASASLHKGDPVIIRGQLRMRSWNDGGKMRSTVEIEAESVGHDVAYGFSHFMKGIHPSLLGFLDGSALAAGLGELNGPGGNGPGGIPDGAGLQAAAFQGTASSGGGFSVADGFSAGGFSANGAFQDRGGADEDGAWPTGTRQSDGPDLHIGDEPLGDPAAMQGSTELASGSGPSGEGGSDDSAGIPDGELASEGVPF